MKETIWDSSDDVIESIYQEKPDIYEFKYNWSSYPEIKSYMQRLIMDTFIFSKEVKPYFQKLIGYVEDFFNSSIEEGFISRANINRIIDSLKDKEEGFRVIKAFHDPGKYGLSTRDEIYVNLKMGTHGNSPSLTEDDILRLYLYHEMGHKILHIASDYETIDNYKETLEIILREKGIENPDTMDIEAVREGFLMIEECLTQELAETLTYKCIGKTRPNYQQRNERASINEVLIVQTNQDFYGIFQIPTILFGKTLRGCNGTTNEQMLRDMLNKALFSNFDQEVIEEYNNSNGELYQDLFRTLRTMGYILHQKYASFGSAEPININVSSCLNTMKFLSNKNHDDRSYPLTGYQKLDYNKYKNIEIQK